MSQVKNPPEGCQRIIPYIKDVALEDLHTPQMQVKKLAADKRGLEPRGGVVRTGGPGATRREYSG